MTPGKQKRLKRPTWNRAWHGPARKAVFSVFRFHVHFPGCISVGGVQVGAGHHGEIATSRWYLLFLSSSHGSGDQHSGHPPTNWKPPQIPHSGPRERIGARSACGSSRNTSKSPVSDQTNHQRKVRKLHLTKQFSRFFLVGHPSCVNSRE